MKTDIRHLFTIGRATKVYDKEEDTIIELPRCQKEKFEIANLDIASKIYNALNPADWRLGSFAFAYKSAPQSAYVEEIIATISRLKYLELIPFLDFHSKKHAPSRKREFLDFLKASVLNNPDISQEYRLTVKSWFEDQLESVQIFSESDPIMNWKKMYWRYECYFQNCMIKGYRIIDLEKEIAEFTAKETKDQQRIKQLADELKEARVKHIKEVGNLSEEMHEGEIYDICHRAQQELEKGILIEGANIAKSAQRKLHELWKSYNEIFRVFRMNHANNHQYIHSYVNVSNPLFEVIDWFAKDVAPVKEDYFEEINPSIKEFRDSPLPILSMTRPKPVYTSHEQLMLALVYSVAENSNRPIEGAFDYLKGIWYFINSDEACFNGKSVEKQIRPLLVSPVIVGKKTDFSGYFNAEIAFSGTRGNITLTETDFITETIEWIEGILRKDDLPIERQRKLKDFLGYIETKRSVIQSNEEKLTPKQLEVKPIFKEEILPKVLECLSPYFPNHETELEALLRNNSIPNSPLLFQGSGKTLLDFFKRLMEGQFLIIAVQRDLEKWISDSFECIHNREPNKITQKYASKVISGSERAAPGNRLIDVKKVNGKFVIEQLEIRNRNQ